MSFKVVCISRSVSAGGEEIGRSVAQQLDFRYVDEEVITRAAQQAQVDPKLVAATEQRKPLLQRIIDRLATGYDMAGVVALGTGIPLDAFTPASSGAYHPSDDDLRTMIRASIYEIATVGRAVIVAHAASMALAGMPDVLRVLITASADTRAQRLAATQGITAAEATTALATSDRERRDYFQRFYQIKEELPTHYDLVINTDTLTPEQAVPMIVTLCS